MTGAAAPTLVIRVPAGTQVLSEDKETVLADLTEVGQRLVFLKGGDGGFGNTRFKSSTNQAPRRADPGWPGEEMWVWLRLKLRSEEHTSELQSLMRISYAVFCLKTKQIPTQRQ